jgi:hypothetical protein
VCPPVARKPPERQEDVLHRKNVLFYRTLNGAEVGDLFMSLLHTCQLCGANSFDCLIELQRHARNWGPARRSGCRVKLSFGIWSPHLPLKQSAQWAVVMAVVLTAYVYRYLGEKTDVNIMTALCIAYPLHRSCRTGAFPPKTASQFRTK